MCKRCLAAFLGMVLILGILLSGCKASGILPGSDAQLSGGSAGTENNQNTMTDSTESTKETTQSSVEETTAATEATQDTLPPEETLPKKQMVLAVYAIALSQDRCLTPEQTAAKEAYEAWLGNRLDAQVTVYMFEETPQLYSEAMSAFGTGKLGQQKPDVYLGVELWDYLPYNEAWFASKGVFADISEYLADDTAGYWEYLSRILPEDQAKLCKAQIQSRAQQAMYAIPLADIRGDGSLVYNTYLTGEESRMDEACRLLEAALTEESFQYLKQMGVPVTMESVHVPASDHDTIYIGVRNPTEDWDVTADGDEEALEAWLTGKIGKPVQFVHFAHDHTTAMNQLRTLMQDPQSRMPDIMWGFTVLENTYHELKAAGAFSDLSPFFENSETMNAYYACFKEKLSPGLLEADGYIPWKMSQMGAMYQFPWLSWQIGNGLVFHPWVSTDCGDVGQCWELLMVMQTDEGCGYLADMGYGESYISCHAEVECDCFKTYFAEGYGTSYIMNKDGIDWHGEYYALRDAGKV